MSINLYKKKTINNQPVLEELLSKDSATVADKPLVYDSTNDNVKSTNDLCVDTVTANCFCGKATCADIADVACTVCVNGVSGTRPILTLGSDGKIYNTGDNVLAGSRCIITPLVSTNYIYADEKEHNNLRLMMDHYDREEEYYPQRLDITYSPSGTTAIQCNADCDSGSRFENGWLGDLNSHGICMCSWDDCNGNASKLFLGKDCTCYCRHDYGDNNNVYNKIMATCAGEISLDTCKWDYGEVILGQGCLDLGICSNILYSKSCLNNQCNYLIQDCAGTCICSYRNSSTYYPTTLQVCFNGIRTNSKNNIAESYLSEKPNSFILHTCDTTNCKTGSIEVDSDSGYILYCTCNGNCGRVDFSQNGVTFIQNNVSSTIIGDQFSGNAATATNATNADNSTCFNNCTYSEACIDIRDGLATQTCADFIQGCVTAIERKIPAQASASNQLADKDFVNSSITTNTANFRGTYACVADLPSTGNTNNDYAFVCSLNTTTGNYVYDRYKWVASNSRWVCEYEINTTGFTAEQLASINSGITDTLVAKITDVYDNTVTICMNDECKCSFSLNQNTDVCIDLGCTIQNATCFDGCTYAQAKADIRNGLISDIGIKVYCGTTCKCTLAKTSNLCLSANAFNSTINMNCVDDATSICVDANSITRKTILRNQITNVGYVTSVAIGLCRGASGFGQAMISVSSNDAATVWKDYCFSNTGTISANGLRLCNNGGVNTGVYIKVGTASSNANRNIMFTPAVPGSDDTSTGEIQTSTGCPLTFNPGTGVLTATCVKGSTSVIAGNPTACTSTQAGRSGTTVGAGALELYSSTPLIDFHVNNACADYSHRIMANINNCSLQVVASNATGRTAATQTATFSFCPNGVFRGTQLCTDCIVSCNLTACGAICLGADNDICIYDECGHGFICGYNHNLTIGYNSNDFVDDSNECYRITVGLDNHMCVSGNDCGNSVVVGICNSVCWQDGDCLGLIFGYYNKTCDGGLAVGGWNNAFGECSVALGWDSRAVDCSIAIGVGAYACRNTSIAIGCDAYAMSSESIAIGCENCVQVACGLVIGHGSYASTYGTACVNSSIRKGPLREITVTWCDSTLRCDIWKAIACNIDLRKNGNGTALTSGCTYLSAIGYISNNQTPFYTCNYNYNSSLATMCTITIKSASGTDIIVVSATCTSAASAGSGGGFLTITGWAR